MEGYNAERFRKDLLAGVIVGIVALPLAMAFAIASGVSPDRGLYTAIVAGAVISIFGGSRVQIGGPTGAMVAILSVILLQYGVNNLLLAGLVAGVMLILMGVFKAGALIRFIPYPVTTGFTSGIAVMSCVVADAKTGDRHDSNKELIGQGIANCMSSVFGGIPATGAIARTATNVRSGGNSPVAGVVHAFTLLVIMLLFAPVAGRVPLASLAPVLMVVAYNMSEIHQIRHILKSTKGDAIVLAITFLLTVFEDLTVAVEFGLLMAAVLFIKRMSDIHRIEKVLPDTSDPKHKVRAVHDEHNDCPQMTMLTVEGALFFGAATKFEKEVLDHLPLIRTLIIRLGRVPVIDATGERALLTIAERCRKYKVHLMISGLQEQPAAMLESTGFLDYVGRQNVYEHTGPAIDRALHEMDLAVCATCPYNAFRECLELKRRGARNCRIIDTLMWSPLLLAIAMAMPVQQPADLDAVMQRASAYVSNYEAALGNLIATEEYLQSWTNGRNARIAQRRTRSDVLLIQVGNEWSALRKVNRVDGFKVKTDQKSFAEAFEDSPANNSKRLLQMKTESTEYNLGNVLREINLPTFALKVLRGNEIERFNFEKSRTEKINGVSTWAVHFAERGLQTLVRGDHGERLYSTGTLWIDPLTGRVLKTEFIVENPYAEPAVKARTVVNYTRGKIVDLLVPKSMQEHYETRGSSIDCIADYSDFRRFEVEVKFDFGTTKPQ